jgi:hypothetical protein
LGQGRRDGGFRGVKVEQNKAVAANLVNGRQTTAAAQHSFDAAHNLPGEAIAQYE